MLTEFRQTLRALLKSPVLTAVALLTLGLGIGVTTSVFTVVDGVLFKSLPYPSADRLVSMGWVYEKSRLQGRGGGNTSPISAAQAWGRSPAFERLEAYFSDAPVFLGSAGAERVKSTSVPAGFFSLLGVAPLRGRIFRPDEDRPGAPPAAVLGYHFWVSHFGADTSMVGRTISLDQTIFEIVGVMPERFDFPPSQDVFANIGATLSGPAGAALARTNRFWVVARLKPGITIESALRSVDDISRAAWTPTFTGWLPTMQPLQELYVGFAREPLLLMFAAAALVLLVACANVAAMLMARALGRQHETAIRVVMGANRSRVLRHVLSESMLLALGGGAIGVLVALWAVPAVIALAGDSIPQTAQIAIDARVVGGAAAIALLAGLVSGLVPALQALRNEPAAVLRGRHSGVTASAARVRVSEAFCVAQVSLTLVLLACAGVLTRSFVRLVHVDPGYDPSHVVVAYLRLPSIYAAAQWRLSWERQVLERLQRLPGVQAAAIASGIPMSGAEIAFFPPPAAAPGGTSIAWWMSSVTRDYFTVFSIPLKNGSWFGATPVPKQVVLSVEAARRYFGDVNPVGREMRLYTPPVSYTVIGVVGDTRQQVLGAPPPPVIYKSYLDEPTSFLKVAVRVSGDPALFVPALRREMLAVDPTVPIDKAGPMTAELSQSVASARFWSSLLAAFAVAALLLAATGIYGVVSHAVARRTHEIGVRLALGADISAVLSLIVGRGAVMMAAGLCIGLAGSFGATRLLKKFLFEVSPMDPVAIGSVSVLLGAAVLLASYIPARRATRVDPIIALREE